MREIRRVTKITADGSLCSRTRPERL